MRRLLSLLILLLPAFAFARQPIELTQEEFKMFRHWQKAMKDPRVEKIKPSRRNRAIARDAGYRLRAMEKAVEKGEAAGDLKAKCEENLSEGLEARFAGRVGKIIVDVSEPHAVVYVQWMNENLVKLEEEASLAAKTAAVECPIASTITVYAQDKAEPKTRVFEALISRSAASKINPERVSYFAKTRYIRLFESVKTAANGDTFEHSPTGTAGAPAAAGQGGVKGGSR